VVQRSAPRMVNPVKMVATPLRPYKNRDARSLRVAARREGTRFYKGSELPDGFNHRGVVISG
jgi:hypothetical protein